MRHVAVGVALAALVGAIYGPVVSFDFVNFDDDVYLVDNPRVAQGLTLENVRWAFTTGHHTNWHPLTWLSWFADVELFGMKPGAFHRTNAMLHFLNCLLLYTVLYRMTSRFGPSFAVAALLAAHPMHVESVAWISERKDVLSMFLLLLTLLAYTEYARKPNLTAFVSVVILYDLGLMAKPMLVTLPLLLLLLDYWPLRRREQGASWRLLAAEKIPLLVLSALSAALTYHFQRSTGAVRDIDHVSLAMRAQNIIAGYDGYLVHFLLPTRLAPYYPYPNGFSAVAILGGVMVLMLITIMAMLLRYSRPFFFTGWWWFVIALIPVIGLIPVGGQAMADRYAYIPYIGLYVAVVWSLTDWAAGRTGRNMLAVAGCLAVVALLALGASRQVRVWRDSESLWRHALAVTEDNAVAHNNLAISIRERDPVEAIRHFERALAIRPDYVDALVNLGNAYLESDRYDDAVAQYLNAATHAPRNALIFANLGLALFQAGRLDEATESLTSALRLNPQYVEARIYLGDALQAKGDIPGAIDQYRNALGLQPDQPTLRLRLAQLYIDAGELAAAIRELEVVLETNPGDSRALQMLDFTRNL